MQEQSKILHVFNFTDYMKITTEIVSNFFNNSLINKKSLYIYFGNTIASEKSKKLFCTIDLFSAIQKYSNSILADIEKFEILKHLFSIKLIPSRPITVKW